MIRYVVSLYHGSRLVRANERVYQPQTIFSNTHVSALQAHVTTLHTFYFWASEHNASIVRFEDVVVKGRFFVAGELRHADSIEKKRARVLSGSAGRVSEDDV